MDQRVDLEVQASVQNQKGVLDDQQVLFVLGSFGVAAQLAAPLRFITKKVIEVLSQEHRQYIRKLSSDNSESRFLNRTHRVKSIHYLSESLYLLANVVLVSFVRHLLLKTIPLIQ